MEIKVEAKAGFRSNDKFIRIYDDKHELFYYKNPKAFPFRFNLPPGTYFTTNEIKPSDIRSYKLPRLPKPERAGRIPDNIQVIYANNPNKASILRDKKCIILDYAIRNLSLPQRVHIRLHEVAHYLYKTEKYCDLWAQRQMLLMGYNPSQIFFAVMGELSNSESSIERKQFILDACENAFN